MRRAADLPNRAATSAACIPTAGFTLFELLIVLILIGVLAGVAIPMMPRGPGERDLKNDALELASHLNLARTLAIRSARHVRFILDVETKAFRVGDEGPTTSLPSDIALELKTAEIERIGKSAGAIRFFPDGSSTGGRIALDRGEHTFNVNVDWMTGRVSIDR